MSEFAVLLQQFYDTVVEDERQRVVHDQYCPDNEYEHSPNTDKIANTINNLFNSRLVVQTGTTSRTTSTTH